jgi:GTPase
VLTGPEPGLTRDAIRARIYSPCGKHLELVDTAGWVRRARLAGHDEAGGAVAAAALLEGRHVMHFVHIVALVVDAAAALKRKEGLTHAEAALAGEAAAEGRALLIVANKMDELPSAAARVEAASLVRRAAERAAPAAARVLAVSALTGDGADDVIPEALSAYEAWNTRLPTAGLNRWASARAAEFASFGGGRDLARVKYVSQVSVRPPTFAAFLRGADPLPEASRRHLANLLRRDFGFEGVPLRILAKRAKPRGTRVSAR